MTDQLDTLPRSLREAKAPWPWWQYAVLVVFGAALWVAAAALDWNLDSLFDAGKRGEALERVSRFLDGFGHPDMSGAYISKCFDLSVSTVSLAMVGVAIGALLGVVIALGATRSLVIGEERVPGLLLLRRRGAMWLLVAAWWWGRRAFIEFCRLLLDALRGVPDFLWVVMLVPLLNLSPITGCVAIALNVAGILGKIYSELWDGVAQNRYEAIRAGGGGNAVVFAYGIAPLAARPVLSFTLMRTECAIRNASVIGAVGGGGLGAEFKDLASDILNPELTGRMVTVLLFLLAVTMAADLLSNFLRRQLRTDPNHPRSAAGATLRSAMVRRVTAGLAAFAAVGVALFMLREDIRAAYQELATANWDFLGREYRTLLTPDVSAAGFKAAWKAAQPTLAIALWGTVGGVALAALLSYPGSVAFQIEPGRFTGERPGSVSRILRWLWFGLARSLAVGARAVPEAAWVLLLLVFFRAGPMAGVAALAVHSAGVLARVFIESVDNVPYRRFEQAYAGSRFRTFVYSALPAVKREWWTYSFFQFESNVRMGVALGTIGVLGLGWEFRNAFDTAYQYDENFVLSVNYSRAATFLFTMVALTVVIDRTSRAFRVRQAR